MDRLTLLHFLLCLLRIFSDTSLETDCLISMNWYDNFILSDFRLSLNYFYLLVQLLLLHCKIYKLLFLVCLTNFFMCGIIIKQYYCAAVVK